ncbi:MAG TPA: ketopantoate reductase family protein [Solirubrobacteraceae bacterium]|nr:ketopantoate reductase family protein [Solirubrobacteraceae bacterium]
MIDAGVLVVGAGAIGGVTAGLMTGRVARVVALDANAEHVALCRAPGLRIDVMGEERVVPLDVRGSVDELDGRFDFALITVKAPALPVVLPALRERDIVETYVSLGNGLVQDRVAAIVGADRMLAGTVEFGGTNLGPGHVAQTTVNPFVIGELDGTVRERTQRLREILETVGEVRVTDNIAGQIWSKLLVNSALSGLGAVGGVLYRDVIGHPDGRQALLSVWREGYRLGQAQDLALEEVLGIEPSELVVDDPAPALRTVAALAGATKASMLQDIERGIATEVDVINGAVVDRARALGSQAPGNATIVELIHAYERGDDVPSPEHFEQVAAAR